MRFLSNVSGDIRLRNLTIYAQWLALIGVIVSWTAELSFVLKNYLVNEVSATYTIKSLVLLFISPFGPLVLELPHYVRRVPFLYLSMVSWYLPVPLWFATFRGRGLEELPKMLFLIISFILSPFVATHIHRQPIPGTGIRVGMYIIYTVLTVSWTGEPGGNPARKLLFGSVFFLWAPRIFFGTAMLYTIAWLKGHPWLSSKTLGGTGIGAMALMLPGQGPLYQSIGNEAVEGTIRLV